jgi:hypothetical protein
MGRKIQAAKASLVAAFLAASGAAAQKAVATTPTDPAAAASASSVSWGDPLLRFIKLDGFPSFWKAQDFAALANFYKPQLTASVADLYFKYDDQVNDVLTLYQKADQGPLGGILIGLEQFYKEGNREPLLDTLKEPGAMDAYIKFTSFYKAMGQVSPEGGGALEFFQKTTGILGDPLQNTD